MVSMERALLPHVDAFRLPSRRARQQVLAQVQVHESYTVRHGGVIVALVCFGPWEQSGDIEMSLLVNDAARPVMLALIRLARLTTRKLCDNGRAVHVLCDPKDARAQRLVRLAGFVRQTDHPWHWKHGGNPHGRLAERFDSQSGGSEASGEPAGRGADRADGAASGT